jgi:hypothetical protein
MMQIITAKSARKASARRRLLRLGLDFGLRERDFGTDQALALFGDLEGALLESVDDLSHGSDASRSPRRPQPSLRLPTLA